MRNNMLLGLLLFTLNALNGQSPIWSKDVACIIFNNCSSCHNNNGIAPFPLLTYEDAKQYAGMIKEAVVEKKMPPWSPDPAYRPLADERLLTNEEIQIISDWIDADTPVGDLAQAPSPPDRNIVEGIESPDLVVQFPTYTSRASNGDEYRCFVMPTNLLNDRFITGFEVIPGNRNMVHHVLVFQDTGDQVLLNDANDSDPGYLCFGGVGSNSAKLIGAWVPGQRVQFMPEDMGIRLPANSHIVVQFHYPAGSAGQEDNTKINFQLSDDANLRELSVDFILNHFTSMVNGPLFIPANTVKTFNQEFKVPFPVTIIGTAPHMHLIGRSIKSWAVTPDGSHIPLIDIPNWEFHWQGFYRFQEAVTLPAGSILKSEAVYDNTTANHHNPNNPPKDVALGEATTDEMMLVAFTWMSYKTGDENLSLQTDEPDDGYSCNALSTPVSDISFDDPSIRLYPNPVDDEIQIQLDNNWQGELQLRIVNNLGQSVGSHIFEKNGQTGNWLVNTANLMKGIYFLSITDGQQVIGKRFLKQ